MFTVWVTLNQDTIADMILMWDACGIFTLVVLNDKLLLVFFDVLPVCFKRDIEDGVASKD